MTDQELKDLVASFAIDRKRREAAWEIESAENKAIHKDMQERNAKYDIMIAEMKEQTASIKKQTEEMKNYTAYLEKRTEAINKQMGNIESNIGYHAEQFFQDIFEERLEFGGIKYDEMVPNLSHNEGNGQIEFDIALVNGNAIALIEVKHRIHPNFVNNFAEDRIGKFRKFFPKFKDYNAYLGIAGFSFDEEVVRRASSHGIGIIRQVGQGVEINAENLKAY